MSVTSTDTVIAAPSQESIRFLASSIDSPSSPRQRKSHISNIYKEASTLFLTRRLGEAFSTLQSILIVRPTSPEDIGDHEHENERRAPIATASRSLRVKVWSLYLTLLDAIIELGPEEGKEAVGSKQWREIASKVRDGTVWDEVVEIGYGGIEGNVDADVVTNLATLLLSQSASQTMNQQHLETYLATSDLSIVEPVEHPTTPTRLPRGRQKEQRSINGTNTPRELASRLKILELYILHVLPANDEWEYAKDLIQLSDTLDEERKDLFHQTLDQLAADKEEEEEQQQKHQQQDHQPQQQNLDPANPTLHNLDPKPIDENPSQHQRSTSEHDYGIEEVKKEAPITTTTTTKPTHRNPPSLTPHPPRILSTLRRLLKTSLPQNPLAILRSILFLLALLLALSRRDVKMRIRAFARVAWEKVQGTVGMGVKVGYV
ncbi:MAG: hypothetical protein Q9182_001146 [Xanthomendoza sp. 2 TL-2023]